MKGKVKLTRENDNKYHVYVKNHFWEKWKVLNDNTGKQIIFETFSEFAKITKIECFDKIMLKIDNFSGFRN